MQIFNPPLARGRTPQQYQAEGRTQPLKDWAQELGVVPGTLKRRLDRGQTMDQVVAHYRGAQLPQASAPPLVPVPDAPHVNARSSTPPLAPLSRLPTPPPSAPDGACPECLARAQSYYQMIHLDHRAQQAGVLMPAWQPPGAGIGAMRPA